jgi:hypothetical protein
VAFVHEGKQGDARPGVGWGDLALIRTLPTEPSESGRTRMSAKVVTAPSAVRKGRLLTQSRTVDWADPFGHRAQGDRCS